MSTEKFLFKERTVKRTLLIILFIVAALPALADDPTVAEVTHRQLQAVDEDGIGTYDQYDSDRVIITGIVLNAPEEMLDPTPSAQHFMGGQWQMYIQGLNGDHAGTAVWLGQYYHKVTTSDPNDSYTDQEYLDELYRVNADPNTGYIFNPGDLVRVTGWYKNYGGKTNINEKHQKDPFFDFEIELLKPAVGLPQPEVVALSDLKSENGFIFDPNRLKGCEFYQGRLVRIDQVQIIDPEHWGPDREVTIADPNGLEFTVKLGIGDGFTRYSPPAGWIDVVGILDQEAPKCTVCDYGYRIWVPDYDGNGLVLTDRGYQRGNLPGDINIDFRIDLYDFAAMAEKWLTRVPGLSDCY